MSYRTYCSFYCYASKKGKVLAEGRKLRLTWARMRRALPTVSSFHTHTHTHLWSQRQQRSNATYEPHLPPCFLPPPPFLVLPTPYKSSAHRQKYTENTQENSKQTKPREEIALAHCTTTHMQVLRRQECGAVLALLVLCVALVLAMTGTHALASETPSSSSPYLLTSPTEVVAAVSTTYYPRPTLILFTDTNSKAALTATARDAVQQLHADIPAELVHIHEYRVSSSDRETVQAFNTLLPVAHLPCLALFGSAVMRGVTVPGSTFSTAPAFMPMLYGGSWGNASAMRQWLLAETPTQYMDPVTYKATPSLNLVMDLAAAAQLVKAVEHDVLVERSRTMLPEYVLFTNAHITADGSQEFLAAVSNLAAQAGERVMAVATESSDLISAVFGRSEEAEDSPVVPWHRLALMTFSAVQDAIVPATSAGTASATAPFTVSCEVLHAAARTVAQRALAHDDAESVSSPRQTQLEDATAAVMDLFREFSLLPGGDTASRTREVMPGVSAPRASTSAAALQSWSQALWQLNTGKSPLQQLTNHAQLQHELRANYNAIKVIFFLRESDRILFSGYRKQADAFAQRATATSVVTYKSLAKKDMQWRPPFLIKAYWVDAEQQAEFAAQLRVSAVPDVAILLPLADQPEQEHAHATHPPHTTLHDLGERSVGIHHVTRHDLTVTDTTTSPVPQTNQEAAVMFPTDPDQLIRFLADPQFTSRVAFMMHALPIKSVRMGTTSSSTGAETAHAVNRQYHPTGAEAPSEYLHSLFTRSLVLPPFDAAEYEEVARLRAAAALKAAHVGSSSEGRLDAATSEKKKRQKEKLQRELEARRHAKEARIRQKARKDAEAREETMRKLQAEVQTALKNNEGEGESSARAAQGIFSVPRPTVPRAEQTDLLAQYRWWQAQSKQMATKYVTVINGIHLSCHTSLELTESQDMEFSE